MLTLNDYKQYDHLYPGITAEIVADSMYPKRHGTRITTFLLTMPLIVMPELTRHRIFSFAISSNRAIPTKKLIKSATFSPIWREKSKSGMQPGSFSSEANAGFYEQMWETCRTTMGDAVAELDKYNATKELTNRLLHPFQYINVLVSGTEFNNFFTLRDHKDAQFELQVLARKMKEKLETNTPRHLERGEWHLPFILAEEHGEPLYKKLAVSTARSARTSYRVPNTGLISEFNDDFRLFNKLLSTPIHASPFEFVATPLQMSEIYGMSFPKGVTTTLYGNTNGWIQLRSFFDKMDAMPEHLYETYMEVQTLKNAIHKSRKS